MDGLQSLRLGGLVAALLLLAALFPKAAAAADLVVDASSDFIVTAEINGHPVRLRVDPETSGYILLNAETVRRLGLRSALLRSQTRIGPVHLVGGSRVASVRIGETEGNRRLVWVDREAVAGADGLIGPADMPYDRVTFTLAEAGPDERLVDLPMEFRRDFGLFFPLMVDDQTIRVQFSLVKPDSMATAAAGAHLASTHDGAWTGDAREQPIELEVVRPVRPLALRRPVSMSGFTFARFLVRTSDNRGGFDLPPEADADPDEIVVSGDRGRQRASFYLTLGLDRLAGCSRLIWDNGIRRLTLSCPGEPGATVAG